MNAVLARWNDLPVQEAVKEILPCCDSAAWADGMVARRPFGDEATLLTASDETWRNLSEADWMEAFSSHPRIGESNAQQSESSQSSVWSMQEQQNVTASGEDIKLALARANQDYEQRFNHTFIVCATGKSVAEILQILRQRLENDEPTELCEVAEQQRQIIRIRLKKWLAG